MDGTYAPQSPDLSSFLSSPPKTQQPYNPTQQSISTSTSYAPRSPVIPSFNHASSAPHRNHNLDSYSNNSAAFGGGSGSDFAEYGTNSYMPPIPALPPSHSFQNAPTSLPPNNQTQYFSPQRPARKVKNEAFSYSELDADADEDYLPPQYQEQQLHPQSPSMSSRGPRNKG